MVYYPKMNFVRRISFFLKLKLIFIFLKAKIDEDLIEFIINLALKESEKVDEALFHASLECMVS